jgi:hypothetical protein
MVSVLKSTSSTTSMSDLPEGTVATEDISHGWSKKHPAPLEEQHEGHIQESTATSTSHMPLSRAVKLSDRTSETATSVQRASMWGRTSVCILCFCVVTGLYTCYVN